MPSHETIRSHRVTSQGVGLNVLETGNPAGRTLLMLHGLRDTAHALLPMAQQYCGDYRILALEHRGHGGSEATDAFTMPGFVLDVHDTVQALATDPIVLLGHSLGGHVAAKYAALFPDRVDRLILVEGLGPPARESDDAQTLAAFRDRMLAILPPRTQRVMPDLEFVAGRLQANNPRLPPAEARRLAEHLSRPVSGGYQWAFDARAEGVFLTTSEADNQRFWRAIQAPTLVVSGRDSYQYWGRMREDPNEGRFAAGEMEARVALMPRGEHHWLADAGHMVHYDQPDKLGQLCRQFLGAETGPDSATE